MGTETESISHGNALGIFSERIFTVRRVSVHSSSPYEEVVEKLEAAVHFLDPNNKERPVEASTGKDLRSAIEQLAQPSGFVLLAKIDHSLLERLGREGRSVQYAIGNPLVAAELTSHDAAIGLYAPFRLAVLEDRALSGAVMLFDDPADLMGSFGNEHAAAIGEELSLKIRELIESLI